ncbi:hypothetical protein Trydic_g7149 [Trypoxylus dichotomus]
MSIKIAGIVEVTREFFPTLLEYMLSYTIIFVVPNWWPSKKPERRCRHPVILAKKIAAKETKNAAQNVSVDRTANALTIQHKVAVVPEVQLIQRTTMNKRIMHLFLVPIYLI